MTRTLPPLAIVGQRISLQWCKITLKYGSDCVNEKHQNLTKIYNAELLSSQLSQVEKVLEWSRGAHLQSLHCSQGEEGVPLDVEDLVLGALEPRLARCCLTWLPARLLLPPPLLLPAVHQPTVVLLAATAVMAILFVVFPGQRHPSTHNRLLRSLDLFGTSCRPSL